MVFQSLIYCFSASNLSIIACSMKMEVGPQNISSAHGHGAKLCQQRVLENTGKFGFFSWQVCCLGRLLIHTWLPSHQEGSAGRSFLQHWVPEKCDFASIWLLQRQLLQCPASVVRGSQQHLAFIGFPDSSWSSIPTSSTAWSLPVGSFLGHIKGRVQESSTIMALELLCDKSGMDRVFSNKVQSSASGGGEFYFSLRVVSVIPVFFFFQFLLTHSLLL